MTAKRTQKSASKGRTSRGIGKRSAGRIGLALAGGGPLGAVYEIGALAALEEQGTIRVEYGGLRVLNLDALRSNAFNRVP